MTEGFQGLPLLESAVSAVARATTPAEIFRDLLVGTACAAPRAVIFLLRERRWKGWKATGYGSLVSQAAQSVSLSDGEGWIARVAASGEPWLEAAGDDDVPDFGQAASETAIAFPVRVGDKAVAIVLVERGAGERPWHPQALAVLVQAVRLRLEFDLACRRLRAAGVASEDSPAVAAEPTNVRTSDEAPIIGAAEPSARGSRVDAPTGTPDLLGEETYEDVPAVAAGPPDAGTYDHAPVRVPEPLTSAPSSNELDPWMEPAAAPPSNSEHDEARRFARLVATDIRLYNEEAVAYGRVEGDLAVRLGEQMQKGRESFERRFPSLGREGMDILRDSFVQVLAGGDASLIPPV